RDEAAGDQRGGNEAAPPSIHLLSIDRFHNFATPRATRHQTFIQTPSSLAAPSLLEPETFHPRCLKARRLGRDTSVFVVGGRLGREGGGVVRTVKTSCFA